MKYHRILILATVILCFLSCADESVLDPEDPQGQGDNEEIVSLVNAFPNLSFSQPLDLQSPDDGSNSLYIAEKMEQSRYSKMIQGRLR